MVEQLVSSLDPFALIVNFLCHITIFFGGLYIAIHSRKIPTWLRTCLWYIGCSSFLIAIMIILGWTIKPEFELSYHRIGFFGEIIFNIFIAITTVIFFINTLAIDIKNSSKRKIEN